MNTRNIISAALLLLLSLIPPLHAAPEQHPKTLSNDPRQIQSEISPDWLAAAGRLTTLIRINKLEQCTLSLVADGLDKNGIIGVTAGHCVDHWHQPDGTFIVGSNTVTFKTNSGTILSRSIIDVMTAEIAPGDYAIVKLDAPIPRQFIQPLINSPFDYQDLLDEQLFSQTFKPYATLAGHSSDLDLGQKGTVLTYHERCQLNGGIPGNKTSNCTSYIGASGGPVVITVDLGEYGTEIGIPGIQHLFVGSVIGGSQINDFAKTAFTENTYYFEKLNNILDMH